jgi:hypothetical protein
MTRYYGIGDAGRKLHAKLAEGLAGPLGSLLPQQWIRQALAEVGYHFRESVFSPLGDAVGLPRAGP